MIRLNNDYNKTALPQVIDSIAGTANDSFAGYGNDEICKKAIDLIKNEIGKPDSDVHFFAGGTQTNLTAVAAALNSIQSVICADTGHINAHEAGSIENCGHKIIALANSNGKITAEQVKTIIDGHGETNDYMTEPKLVYISVPTEYGAIYSLKELEDLSAVCRKNGLYLFADGARLAYALTAENNDVTIKKLAELTDMFYIGGTKCGAMFGEALVITNDSLKPNFRKYMKQNGAILAKGWLLGAQFDALFRDGLYYSAARRANVQALKIKDALMAKGFIPYADSCTNQQFFIMDKKTFKKLSEKYVLDCDKKLGDDKIAVRFCTAWSTDDRDVEMIIADICRL